MDLVASVGLSLSGAELPFAAEELRALLATDETPDLHLALGLVVFLGGELTEAEMHLRTAFLGFQREQRARRAALATTHLGRLEHSGFANPVVAAGWFARGMQILNGDDDCVERGWLALGMLGCAMSSADALRRDAELALRLARTHHDVDLECRALADYGLALVTQGAYEEGMAQIDQAMTMVHSGECVNLYITGQVQCSFVSACERAGDLPRLEGWLAAAARAFPHVLGPTAEANVMLNHCRIEYGHLLCEAGRWTEADATLRQAAIDSARLQAHQQILANTALANLRVSQGRLAEAAELLAGLDTWDEASVPLIRLHLARGDHDLAATLCREALRHFAGDRLRGCVLLGLLVDAELSRGALDAAAEVAAGLVADGTARPPRCAQAALTLGRLALARGEPDEASALFERGIAALGNQHWPLLCAELHLEQAQVLARSDVSAAVVLARRALAVFGPLGAPQRFAAQKLLHRLGIPDSPREADPLAVLTRREREILGLVVQGLSNPEIATRLVISPKTAEHHVSAILRKLGLRGRGEAGVFAATLSPLGRSQSSGAGRT